MVDPASANNLIELAFIERIEALALTLNLPIAHNNATFDPPEDGRYLELRHLPNTPVNFYLGFETGGYRGIYQVNVFVGKDDGTFIGTDYAGRVIAEFWTAGKTFVTTTDFRLKIEAQPSIGTMINNGPRSYIPVSIRYRSMV